MADNQCCIKDTNVFLLLLQDYFVFQGNLRKSLHQLRLEFHSDIQPSAKPWNTLKNAGKKLLKSPPSTVIVWAAMRGNVATIARRAMAYTILI